MKSFSFSTTPNRLSLSLVPPPFCRFRSDLHNHISISLLKLPNPNSVTLASIHRRFSVSVSSETSNGSSIGVRDEEEEASPEDRFRLEVRSPSLRLLSIPKLSLSDRAFVLLAFIGCTTCVAFTSFVIAAIPTMFAMGRAAKSFSKLADTAREELPSTMAAIRLSGMEISDLTLELSDLSQEISDGVTKSSQAVQAAGAGIRQIGVIAREQTMSMIEERANLPVISLKPVVVGVARKTSQAVGRATKSLFNMITGGEADYAGEEDNVTERVDLLEGTNL